MNDGREHSRFEGARVMVVEDMALVAAEIDRQLKILGCQVLGPYPTLDSALSALRAEPEMEIDVALLDVNLSGRDCYPIADVLDDRFVPFCFLTGYLPDFLSEKYAGIPVLQKPFSVKDLEVMLRGLLETASHRDG